jgi:hypothetical protein
VTIVGAGMGRTVLDGGNVGRVVTETGSTATLQDLSVEHGHVDYFGGGALSNSWGTLRVVRSRVADSWTGWAGGGISSEFGELSVIDSIITANTSDGSSQGGGGIYARQTALTLTRSTVSANRGRSGGGLYVDHSDGTTSVADSTISGNTSSFYNGTVAGAAVFVSRDSRVAATHVTIAGNHADGGAVVAIDSNGRITFAGSVVAGNNGNSCAKGPSGVVDSSYTVVADGSCGSGTHDATNVDPVLVPLLDGGGQTTAYSFAATSIAHDAIPLDNPLCDGTDQHGVSRRNPNVTGCDEGAVQLNSQDALTPNITAVDFGRIADGTSGTATITLTNNGQHPAKITGVATTGDGFHLAGNDCPPAGGAGLLPDGPSCRVTVTFTPTAAPYRGALSITADLSTAGATLIIPLTGNGVGLPTSHSVPTITGTATVGGTLNATTGAWGGSSPIVVSHQWQRCTGHDACTPIPDATGTSYAPTVADIGATMAVTDSASNARGGSTATGYAAGPVAAAAPVNQVHPSIVGPSLVGTTLTVNPGTWTGTAPITFDYQWLRCPSDGGSCDPIPGATTTQYTITRDDIEYWPSVEIHAHNPANTAVVAYTDDVPWVPWVPAG